MFKIPGAGTLLMASKLSIKLCTSVSSFHSTTTMQLKEILANKVGNTLVIEAINVQSPRKDYLIQNNTECCSLCSLDLNVKHTDVLILSQFVRPDGRMLPQRVTRLCKTQQKIMSKLVLMAHKAGLMCSLGPENSKKDPTRRKLWKKYNTYFDESTIRVFENHFYKARNETILNSMKNSKSLEQ